MADHNFIHNFLSVCVIVLLTLGSLAMQEAFSADAAEAESKVTVTFESADPEMSVSEFTYSVEISAETGTQISVSDIYGGLASQAGSLLSDLFPGYCISSISGESSLYPEETVDDDGESSYNYPGSITVNVSSDTTYTVELVSRYTISYNELTDSIDITDIFAAYSRIYYADVTEKGKKLSCDNFKYKSVSDGEVTIPLNDSNKGLKIAESKDAYLYITADRPASDKITYLSNYEVEASPYSKLKIQLNYAAADPTSYGGATASFNPISISADCIYGSDPDLGYGTGTSLVSDSASGSVSGSVSDAVSSLAACLLISTDGKEWNYLSDGAPYGKKITDTFYRVSDSSVSGTELCDEMTDPPFTVNTDDKFTADIYFTVIQGHIDLEDTGDTDYDITIAFSSDADAGSYDGFYMLRHDYPRCTLSGASLYDVLYNNSSVSYLYFKVPGDPGSEYSGSASSVYSSTPFRSSAMLKLRLKTPAKAPTVKIDAKKGTVSIKNSYDYAVMTDDDTVPSGTDWITIPKYKKGGELADRVASSEYASALLSGCRASDQLKYTTSIKVSSMVCAELYSMAISKYSLSSSPPDSIYVCVRKSAGNTSPASFYTCLAVSAAAEAPVMSADSHNSSVYAYIDEAKRQVTVPVIKNASGDKAASQYEYCVIAKEDISNCLIETAKWTKLRSGSKISVDRLKCSGYTVISEYGYTKKSGQVSSDNAVIMIRRCGVKGASAADTYIPSEPLATCFTSEAWVPYTY